VGQVKNRSFTSSPPRSDQQASADNAERAERPLLKNKHGRIHKQIGLTRRRDFGAVMNS
jgi:hypothetical protein